jgi:uroporphyrinogen decarboxylase
MELFLNQQNSDLIKRAMRLEKVDKVPFYFSDQLDFLGGWLNLDRELYHFNAEIKLKAQTEFNKRFKGGGILGPNFGVSLEPSAFGAHISFKNNTPPWVTHLIKNVDDIPEFARDLEIPNPLTDGLLPLFYQTYFYMQSLTNNQLGAPLGVIAGIDVASLLVGFDNLCLSMILYPESAHELFSKINKFLIQFIETKARICNVKSIDVIDLYGDYAGFVPVELFLEFVSPYNKEVYNYFNPRVRFYHCDGPLSHLIDLLPDMCNCLYDFDPTTDISLFVDKIGDRVCLIGNIAPIEILRNGTPQQVYEETARIVKIGKKAKGFVFAPGGEVANGTPPENLDAAIKAVEEFGKY